MKNAPNRTNSIESAQDKRDSIHTVQYTPRQSRALEALLNSGWIEREQIDRIAGASNGPQIISELRRKVTGHDGIDMQRVERLDRDGKKCKPGRYRLNDIGRSRVAALGVRNG